MTRWALIDPSTAARYCFGDLLVDVDPHGQAEVVPLDGGAGLLGGVEEPAGGHPRPGRRGRSRTRNVSVAITGKDRSAQCRCHAAE